MAITRVKSANSTAASVAASGTTTVVFGSNVAVGNVVVLLVTSGASSNDSIPDILASGISGFGATWTASAQNAFNGLNPFTYIFWAKVVSAGTTITITNNGNGPASFCKVAEEYNGCDDVLDVDSDKAGTSTTPDNSTPTSGTNTTTNANDVILACGAKSTNTAPTSGPTSSYSTIVNQGVTGSGSGKNATLSHFQVTADQIVTATGTYSTTWTFAASNNWEITQVCLKATAAAVNPVRPNDIFRTHRYPSRPAGKRGLINRGPVMKLRETIQPPAAALAVRPKDVRNQSVRHPRVRYPPSKSPPKNRGILYEYRKYIQPPAAALGFPPRRILRRGAKIRPWKFIPPRHVPWLDWPWLRRLITIPTGLKPQLFLKRGVRIRPTFYKAPRHTPWLDWQWLQKLIQPPASALGFVPSLLFSHQLPKPNVRQKVPTQKVALIRWREFMSSVVTAAQGFPLRILHHRLAALRVSSAVRRRVKSPRLFSMLPVLTFRPRRPALKQKRKPITPALRRRSFQRLFSAPVPVIFRRRRQPIRPARKTQAKAANPVKRLKAAIQPPAANLGIPPKLIRRKPVKARKAVRAPQVRRTNIERLIAVVAPVVFLPRRRKVARRTPVRRPQPKRRILSLLGAALVNLAFRPKPVRRKAQAPRKQVARKGQASRIAKFGPTPVVPGGDVSPKQFRRKGVKIKKPVQPPPLPRGFFGKLRRGGSQIVVSTIWHINRMIKQMGMLSHR